MLDPLLATLVATTLEYANDLKKSISAQLYATMVASMGTSLNSPKDRFDKSDIIEQVIMVASNDRLKWVDGVGRDHNDTSTGLDIEFKYLSYGMITKSGNNKKKVSVKIKNSNGTNKNGATIKNPADYYMLGQENAIAIISYTDMQPYLTALGDGISAEIPFDKLTFVFRPEDVDTSIVTEFNYKKWKAQAQMNAILEAKDAYMQARNADGA